MADGDSFYTLWEMQDLAGLKSKEIADELNITVHYWESIRGGRRRLTADKLAKFLNFILGELDKKGDLVNWERVPGFHDIATMQSDGWSLLYTF